MSDFARPTRTIITLFLSATGEMTEEAEILQRVVGTLNRLRGVSQGFQVEIKTFRTHVASGVAGDAQALINDELGPYDLYLGLMRHTLGTPTPRAASGTVEELELALKGLEAGAVRRVMFFFRAVDPEKMKDWSIPDRFAEVSRFKQTLAGKGLLYKEYGELSEFEALVERELTLVLDRLLAQAAERPEPSADTQTSARAPGEIGPEDRALVLNVSDTSLRPPAGAQTWEDVGFQQIVMGPRTHFEGINDALGSDPLKEELWREVLGDVDAAIKDVTQGLVGRLHVYLVLPHPLALYVGHRLRERARGARITVHQFFNGWTPLYATDHPEEAPFFKVPPDAQPEVSGGAGAVLAIAAGRTPIPNEQLKAFCRDHRAGYSVHLSPAGALFLSGIDQGAGAVAAMEGALRQAIQKGGQGAPLHIITTAPLALLVGLGLRLPARVFNNIIAHQYLTVQKRYQQVLEVISGEVRPRSRIPLLRIYPSGSVFLFKLNDRLLECGLPLALSLPEPEGSASGAAFRHGEALRDRLPRDLFEAINALPELDIRVESEGIDSGDGIPWELLLDRPSRRQDGRPTAAARAFASVRPGWALFRAPLEPDWAHLKPQAAPKERLSILLVNAFHPDDVEGQSLDLDGWADALRQAGCAVELLEAREGMPLSLSHIHRRIRAFKPDVLHWVGHGRADERDLWGPILEAQPGGERQGFHKAQLSATLEAAPVPLVILSACSAGASGPGFGVPAALISGAAGAVVAFQRPVTTRAVTDFSRVLYGALLGGRRLAHAVQEARHTLYLDGSSDPQDFGAPVLWAASQAHVGPLVTSSDKGDLAGISGGSGAPLPLPDPKEVQPLDVAQSASVMGWPSDGDGGTLPLDEPKELETDPGVFGGNGRDLDLGKAAAGAAQKSEDNQEKPRVTRPERDQATSKA